MIDETVYGRVRNGVCAVGYLTQPLPVYRENLKSSIFQVIGTGFLVHDNTVLTNRHVVDALIDVNARKVAPNTQLFVQFLALDQTPPLIPRMIRTASYLASPEPDLGFLTYKTVRKEHFQAIQPVQVTERWDVKVTEEIAVCGYPYGTYMLERGTTYRWGPVVQRGHVSSVSPFDTSTTPNDILLDVRTASGMSGAPVFRPKDGMVVGVHYAGIEATTAFAIPITKASVAEALTRSGQNKMVLNEG